jgi:hypothetical protein
VNLADLIPILKAQAKLNKAVVLNETLLSNDLLTHIRSAFLLEDSGYFSVTGVSEDKVPDHANHQLVVNGGTACVFGQQNIPVKLIFSVADNNVQVLIHASMSDSLRPKWTFEDSFPEMDQFPFNRLAITDACFVYSTLETKANAKYAPWAEKPDQTITLNKGLNFGSWLSLKQFSSVLKLTGIVSEDISFKFSGPFEPSPDSLYPIGSLSALLSDKSFSIGYDPLTLTLDKPTFVTQITTDDDWIPEISCSLSATSSLGLIVSMEISPTDGAFSFEAEVMKEKKLTPQQISELPGCGDFITYVPDTVKDIFDAISFRHFSLVMLTDEKKVGSVSLSIGNSKSWEVISSITLDNLVLDVDIINPSSDDSIKTVSLSATSIILHDIFTKGAFSFSVNCQKTPGNSWTVESVYGTYMGSVRLYDIVKGIQNNAVVPDGLKDITFSDFGMAVDRTNNTYICFGICGFGFPILGLQLSSTVTINIAYANKKNTVRLCGNISISEQNFAFDLGFTGKQGSKSITLEAAWETQDEASYLQFEDIASAFGFSIPKDRIPSQLNLALKSATLYYDFSNDVVVLSTESDNYGDAVFVATKTDDVRTYVFGIKVVTKNIDLAGLPLIGPDLVNVVGNVGLDNIQLLVSNATLEKGQVEKLNGMISTVSEGKAPTLPETPGGIVPGAYVTLTLRLGDSNTYELLVNPSANATPDKLSAFESSDGGSNASWVNLQRSIGPVYISKAGVAYEDGKLYLMVDAALLLSALTIGFTELGVGNPLNAFRSFVYAGWTFGEFPVGACDHQRRTFAARQCEGVLQSIWAQHPLLSTRSTYRRWELMLLTTAIRRSSSSAYSLIHRWVVLRLSSSQESQQVSGTTAH